MPMAELTLKYSNLALIALCVAVLIVMARKGLIRQFPVLAGMISVQLLQTSICGAILFFRPWLGLEVIPAYKIYFYTYWIAYAAMALLQVLVIYSVFSQAMKPLQGLHQIGKIVFRWVAAVSVMVSIVISVGPHLGPNTTADVAFVKAAQQADQGIGVLTLCLLLFVCFSTKPLGLTYGSRIFGIVLGLGVMATTILVQAAWSGISPSYSLYSPIASFGVIGNVCAVAVWGTYFALPEPQRKLVLLPTTSPFFFWNRISEVLGDAPGHVAIAGFRPDMLAPAEMQMLSAPSLMPVAEPVRNYSRQAPLFQPAVNS